jgi:hypothetical protein
MLPYVLVVVLLFLVGASMIEAFTPIPKPPPSGTRVHLTAEDLTPEMMAARSNFFFWFVGASGAAGLARSAFPRMYSNVVQISELGKTLPQGKSSNSDMVGFSPLCGYPRDVTTFDVNLIVNNKLSIEQIVKKYPVEGNFLSAKGYITYEAFAKANTAADPLAVRAVFDCFAQSTPVSNPEIAQSKIDSYKQSLDKFKSDLLYSKATGWASIVTLLGLLGLADIEAFNFAYTGWFPDWPGGQVWLERGLFDPETGLGAIPQYWK